LSPIHIQKDERIDGLVKLLTIPLIILVLIDKTMLDSIAKRGEKLSGLFRYNPKKKSADLKLKELSNFLRGYMPHFVMLRGYLVLWLWGWKVNTKKF